MNAGVRATVLLCASALLLAACAQTPVKPAATHLKADAAPVEGQIPPPVQIAPLLPKPRPAARLETYSVVVNNVRVHDLLFALARDAKLNVDIHSDIAGTVTLNAIDQTLPQLLARIARQVDMRYEIEGQNLSVMRDTPFLRSYKIDYLSAARNVKMSSLASTQFASSNSATGAATTSGTNTGATAQVDVTSENKLWESIVVNVKDILRETDKIIPKTQPLAAAAPQAAPAGAATPAPGASAPAQAPQQSVEFIEVASVIAHRESGVLYVRATSRQHEKVQEFLDQVLVGARRQVLIEATVAEVQLNNQYQRGIDWQRLRSNATTIGRPGFGTGQSGVEFGQNSTGTPAAVSTTAFVVGGAITSLNFNFALSLLESFGDVKVLSSPKLSVLNNQTALLRVTRDIIYFQITPSNLTISGGGGGTIVAPPSFTTTPLVAAEGFMMSVLPQINEADTIVLNVRPTIRRRVGNASDPNPALTTPNLIPIFETREFDSVLRLQSGQIAVLGGLMQDQRSRTEDTIPGVNAIPGLGELLEQRNESNVKTELVIFLRATVVREPSLDGDYRSMRGDLPGDDFFLRPNPARVAPPIGPGESQR